MVEFVKLPRIAIAAVVLVVVVVAGVAVFRDNGTTNRPTYNAADVMFAQMMIPHHEQAIDMAEMALNPSRDATEELRTLAADVKRVQAAEVATLTDLLGQWGESSSMHDHAEMMDGMLSLDELAALGNKKGPAFDQSWARAMIDHHRGAISMAREVETSGVNRKVRQLARDIVKAQRSEIAVLQRTMNSR